MRWKNLIGKPSFVFACLVLAAACGSRPEVVVVTTPTAAVAQIDTATPLPSETPSPTASLTPSVTPTATPSPSPTPTPTSALPLYLATPLPPQFPVITSANIAGLREIAFWGSPIVWRRQITGDGKLGFVATSAGIAVYDAATGESRGLYEAIIGSGQGRTPEAGLSLSQDGSRFAVLSQNTVQVWGLSEGLILEMPLIDPQRWLHQAVISPDGRLLAVHDGKTVIYEIDSGQALEDLPHFYHGRDSDVLFSPDGAWFAEWDFRSGTIWRTKDWSKHRDFILNPRDPRQAVRGFSTDGRLLAFQDQEHISIYQVEDWRLKRQIAVHSDKAKSTQRFAFSPSGTLVAIWESIFDTNTLTSERVATVWDIATGERLTQQTLADGFDAVGDDGSLTTREIPAEVYETLSIGPQWSCSMSWWAPRLSVEGNGAQFQVWTWTSPEAAIIKPGVGHDCHRISEPIVRSENGEFFVVRKAKEPDVYEVRSGFDGNGPVVGRVRSQAETLRPIWLSANGQRLLLSNSTHLGGFSFRLATELWDIQQEVRLQRWSDDSISHFVVSRDGNLLALGFYNDQQLVYSVSENRTLYSIDNPFSGYNTPLAFTEAGELINVAYSSTYDQENDVSMYSFEFRVIDLERRRATPLAKITQIESYIDAVAVSPDSRLLAIGLPDGTIRVIDMDTHQEIHAWQAHVRNVTQLAFSADGTLLASLSISSQDGGDGFLKVWGVWP